MEGQGWYRAFEMIKLGVVTADNIITLMVECAEKWKKIADYVVLVMKERVRRDREVRG